MQAFIKIFLSFALFNSKLPFIPFHLISVFLIWQNIKPGKDDFGYVALSDFNYSNTIFLCSPLPIILLSET